MSLYVLAVDNTGDRRDVKPGLLGYILEHHGPEVALISIYKVIVLEVQDGPHGFLQGVVALLQGFHEPFGRIQLLLYKGRRLFLGAVLGVLGVFQDVGILAVYTDFPLSLGENDGEAEYSVPDRILWNGETWRVVRVRDWSIFGYYQALAVKICG